MLFSNFFLRDDPLSKLGIFFSLFLEAFHSIKFFFLFLHYQQSVVPEEFVCFRDVSRFICSFNHNMNEFAVHKTSKILEKASLNLLVRISCRRSPAFFMSKLYQRWLLYSVQGAISLLLQLGFFLFLVIIRERILYFKRTLRTLIFRILIFTLLVILSEFCSLNIS